MKNKLELAAQRTRGYWHVDGLGEIFSGIIFALLGIIYSLRSASWLPFSASEIKDTALILGLVFGLASVIWLKQNITYRRTGYVEYKRENFGARLQRYWKVIALMVGVPIVLIVMMLIFPWARAGLFYGLTWIPAVIGFGFGIFMFARANQTGLKRFRTLCYLGIALGVTLAILAGIHNLNHALSAQLFASPLSGLMPAELAQAMQTNMDYTYWLAAILSGGLGLMLLVSGIFTLIRYLQANPNSELQHDQ